MHGIAGENTNQETLEGTANSSLKSEEEDLEKALSESGESLKWVMILEYLDQEVQARPARSSAG